MLIVGLVGGVASGKSRVADCFESLGAVVLDGDQVGHQVLRLPVIKKAIRNRWGEAVFREDGEVERGKLAQLVFEGSEKGNANLKFLEDLVHPEIRKELMHQLDKARKQGVATVILDAPVLFKAGWDRLCDEIVFVDASRETRLQRAKKRGWTEAMFDQRENSQTPLAIKKMKSTCILANSGDWSETEKAARKLWNSWQHRDT